jgi:hypothetical protein
MQLAQRYPDAYDGILANAPAMHANEVFSSMHWPYQAMLNAGTFPPECMFDAITKAAIAACDELDGIADGVITAVEQCRKSFDPFSVVGNTIECATSGVNDTLTISTDAAQIMKDTWGGITTKAGEQVWFGFAPGTDMTGNGPTAVPNSLGPLETKCEDGVCVGVTSILGGTWFQNFLVRDLEVNLSTLTHNDFTDLVHYGKIYRSFFATDDSDLSRFRKAGGKLLTAHGIVSDYDRAG